MASRGISTIRAAKKRGWDIEAPNTRDSCDLCIANLGVGDLICAYGPKDNTLFVCHDCQAKYGLVW